LHQQRQRHCLDGYATLLKKKWVRFQTTIIYLDYLQSYLFCKECVGVAQRIVFFGCQARMSLLHQAIHKGGFAVVQVTNHSNVSANNDFFVTFSLNGY